MNSLKLALVGAPNSGKTTLFNGLTGGSAKTANYAGVTVETRSGRFETLAGATAELVDLPGVYGLEAGSIDEKVAVDAIMGEIPGETPPDALIMVIDAAHLRTHLHTVLQFKTLGRPMIVALNMIDLAERDGMQFDIPRLEAALGVPVIPTRATRSAGRMGLIEAVDANREKLESAPVARRPFDLKVLQREARLIANDVIIHEPAMNRLTRVVDSVVLHPFGGLLILFGLLFLMFQAVFAWAGPFMDLIDGGFGALGDLVGASLPEGLFRSFIVDGIIAGVGSVLVFLPQIIILFCFILLLEASGYMSRAAFLLDSWMLKFGLNGRAFIPLLSSFACAIPGVMAARTIESEKDRLTTIMVAPLMTCSARLPVYTLLISAFIPKQTVMIGVGLQGLVMFCLYMAGVVSAILIAFILKQTATRGPAQPLIMELPTYKAPQLRDFLLGLWIRISAFLKRAGTIIFASAVGIWVLVTFPMNAEFKDTFAGRIGTFLEPLFAPIGFNAEMVISLIPGMAAREVAVSVLATVYAVRGGEENTDGLVETLAAGWTLPMALAFLAWFVYAPQCFATLATVRRETNSWKWTGFMTVYLFSLAYVAAGAVYWISQSVGL